MVKYIVFAIIVISIMAALIVIIQANSGRLLDRPEDMTSREELERLKKDLEIKMQTLKNRTEIQKLMKKRDEIVERLDLLS